MDLQVEQLLAAPDDAGRFSLELALRLMVEIGPMEESGSTHDGVRRNYPIIGGRFRGPDIAGEVIGSGADISLERHDGVTLLDAVYRIRAENGQVIVVDNKGIWRKADEGRDGSRDGFYLRTTPRFLAPEGPHAWLNRSIFVGTVDDLDENRLIVSCYRLFGF